MKKTNLFYLLLLCLGETHNNTHRVLFGRKEVQEANTKSAIGFNYNYNVYQFDVRDQIDYANSNIDVIANNKKYGNLSFYVESLSLISSADNYEYLIINYEVDYTSQDNFDFWIYHYYGVLNELNITVTDVSTPGYYSSIIGHENGDLISLNEMIVSCDINDYFPEAFSEEIRNAYSTELYLKYNIPSYGTYLRRGTQKTDNQLGDNHQFILYYNDGTPSSRPIMLENGKFYGMFIIKASNRGISNLSISLNAKYMIVKKNEKFNKCPWSVNASTSFDYRL